jgi:hypothetical protein
LQNLAKARQVERDAQRIMEEERFARRHLEDTHNALFLLFISLYLSFMTCMTGALPCTDQRFPKKFDFLFSSLPKPGLPTLRCPLSVCNVIDLGFFFSPANCRQAKEAEEEEERRRQRVNQVKINYPTMQNRMNVYIFRPVGSAKPLRVEPGHILIDW